MIKIVQLVHKILLPDFKFKKTLISIKKYTGVYTGCSFFEPYHGDLGDLEKYKKIGETFEH